MGNRDVTGLAVETTSGVVYGFVDRGVPNWRGVPYGRVEERFRPPHPVTPAERVDADRWGPVAWQVPIYAGTSWSAVHSDAVEREDCLNLNLWSPGADPAARRPVLVWLHPGGHVYGCGSMPTVDAWVFAARHDAVIVTANYRLGPWGWLYLGDADPAFKDSANLAVLDQVMLLRWIQDNIERFGGDPDNVTIFGSSSGASDVATLMGVPAARGLFHKAAIYSGNAEEPRPRGDAVDLAGQFLAAAGSLAGSPAELAALPNVAIRRIHRRLLQDGLVPYGPFIDGDIIPRLPLDSIAAGLSQDVPVLVSTTAEEGGMYEAFSADSLDHMYTSHVGPVGGVSHAEKVAALTRTLFVEPAERLLTAVTGTGGVGWAQVFDYHPTVSPLAAFPAVAGRAVHGVDLSALFIDPEGTAGDETDRAVGADEQAALMGLAREGRPDWAPWSPESRAVERIEPISP